MRGALLTLAVALGLAGPALAACPVPPRGQALPYEATPSPVPWDPWRGSVDALTARLRQEDVSRVRLVFLGDSLTQGWQPQIFQQFFGQRAPLNLGIVGDATQGTLWRLENGNWPPALHPQLIVLMIGTNNVGNSSRAEDVAAGISEIIGKLRRLSPNSRILLLGILPRGSLPTDPTRPVIARVNQIISSCADGRNVFFANPGGILLDGQGNLADYVSFDQLHLTMVGYALLAAAIEPAIRQGLGSPPAR